ncbi:MAG: hypothetical protein CM1200mP27_03600 [Chloroflexota bacterium]|nr:MAG: hypothetical protein CM1200mP27_03600 [Chloroflexota bacterium]
MQDGRRLEVRIPPGVDNGSKVHIAADSGPGSDFPSRGISERTPQNFPGDRVRISTLKSTRHWTMQF